MHDISLDSPRFDCFRAQTGIHFNPPGRDAAQVRMLVLQAYKKDARLRARLCMLGNAVAPLQAALAFCFLSALPTADQQLQVVH